MSPYHLLREPETAIDWIGNIKKHNLILELFASVVSVTILCSIFFREKNTVEFVALTSTQQKNKNSTFRKSSWWFQISFIFTPAWGNDPI